MYFSYKSLLLIFSIVFKNGFAALFEGDMCTIPTPKMNGVCKLISLCLSAQEGLATKGIYPTICGFKDDQPIVCCADSIVTDPTANGKTSTRNTVPITPSKTTQTVGEKSKQKCIEYGKYVYESPGIVPIPGRPPPPDRPNCAVIEVENIVGGTPAKSKEFPHMALIGFQEEGTNEIHWDCGGTLISEKFVLSAGHCTFHRTYQEPKYILLGELVLDNTTDDAKPQQISIKNITTHPEFLSPSRYNDIALFELEREADLGVYTRPACLNTNPSLTNKLGVASGWGQNSSSDPTSKEMQKVTLDMYENSECNRTFGRKVSKELAHGVVETQLCAGSRMESKDTCQGDSGGPLQVINSKEVFCTYNIIGITSFGKGCGIRGIPAVYTRVSSYIEWIENIVWPS